MAKILNIHTRRLNRPKKEIERLIETLATDDDLVWPTESWPRMKLDRGLAKGSTGGHGPIGYSIKKFDSGRLIEFEFSRPEGFNGVHRFEINELDQNETELRHVIDITTTGLALLSWPLAIRWLHDALIEDAFDKVENHFTSKEKNTEWSWWVKILRKVMKPKNK